MDTSFNYDVFLSHNSKDKPEVRLLAEGLQNRGLRVWFDEWILKPGDDIYLEIEKGLETSRTLVLIMSPAAFGSDWVGLERSTALFRDPSNKDRRFIPLLLKDTRIPDTLRRFKYIDYRDPDQNKLDELVFSCDPSTIFNQNIIEPPARKKSVTYTGKTKIEFCRRLGNDWKSLADYFEIIPAEQARFGKGDESREIWDWLYIRDKIGELPEGCGDIGRVDLKDLF